MQEKKMMCLFSSYIPVLILLTNLVL